MKIRREAEAVLGDSKCGMHGPVFVWEQTAVCQAKRLLILLDALEDMKFRTHSNETKEFIASAIKAAEEVE